MSKKTIALIEDEQALAMAMKEKFTQEGYDVEQAFDGEEAIKLLESKSFDLVVLDLILPKVHGLEVLKTLKKNPERQSTPVLVLTNLSDPEMVGSILEAGGTDYLVKADQSLDAIAKKIKEMLAGGSASQ
jgi:DNA-binding response OmpR family regulator